MEIHLDRKMAEKRLYPADNVNRPAHGRGIAESSPMWLQKIWICAGAVSVTIKAMESCTISSRNQE